MKFGTFLKENPILLIFSICFIVLLVISCVLRVQQLISNQDCLDLLSKLFSLYSVHIGMILGGIYGRDQRKKNDVQNLGEPDSSAYSVAIFVSFVWNVLVVLPFIPITLSIIGIDAKLDYLDLSSYLDLMQKYAPFLVTGALAYMYTNQTTKPD
jgi:hypothetical protein